jgi:dihydroorotate dehydrogenase electron transfer subunit
MELPGLTIIIEMKTYTTQIVRVLEGGSDVVTVDSSTLPIITPGQYFRSFIPGNSPILPIPLYLYSRWNDELSLCGKVPLQWKPGEILLLQGPFGQGFQKALTAKRLTLYAHDKLLEPRLKPLALSAVQNKMDVTWVSDERFIFLPPQVEILKSSDLHSAIAWSDASAIAASLAEVDLLRELLPRATAERDKIEVFIDTPQICGNSLCDACAIETHKGWKLVCKDGPVFPLRELLSD